MIVHTLALLTQAGLAGEFLSGTDEIVKFHEWTAWSILGICVVQIVLAGFAARSWWLLIGSVFVLLAEALQTGTGYGRFMNVHIPLGVIAFGIVLLQTISQFTRPARK